VNFLVFDTPSSSLAYPDSFVSPTRHSLVYDERAIQAIGKNNEVSSHSMFGPQTVCRP